jgi:hypothetical protein
MTTRIERIRAEQRKLAWLRNRRKEVERKIRVLLKLGWNVCSKKGAPIALAFALSMALPARASFAEMPIRMNGFIHALKLFSDAYTAGRFDVRLARSCSRQWREVEQSGGWPEPEQGDCVHMSVDAARMSACATFPK